MSRQLPLFLPFLSFHCGGGEIAISPLPILLLLLLLFLLLLLSLPPTPKILSPKLQKEKRGGWVLCCTRHCTMGPQHAAWYE